MNRLTGELRRLYFLLVPALGGLASGEAAAELALPGADGTARAMLFSFLRAADWPQAALLYQAVHEDLELPAPAVSISGSAGYQLWFSLATPLPAAQLSLFMQTLCRVYLPDMPTAQRCWHPHAEAASSPPPEPLILPPALHPTSGKWSSFIDPGLGSMFIDAPGLEMAPNIDRQADLLRGLKSIAAADFQRALKLLQERAESAIIAGADAAEAARDASGRSNRQAPPAPSVLDVGTHFDDPQSFLLAVMNDASAPAELRVEAARALLPYIGKGRGQ